MVVSAFIATHTLALAARPSANHLSKPAMEEAASLFGPADPTLDPFGSIVTNGGDDHARGSTSPSSGLSEAREADIGNDWLNGSSNHYQSEHSGSLQHTEHNWHSSDDPGGHYNSQPNYEGSTPTSFTYYHQPPNTHVGDNTQYMASHAGEWPPSNSSLGLNGMYGLELGCSWQRLWNAAALRAECRAIIFRTVLYSAVERRFTGRSHVICACACSPRATCASCDI